MVLTAKLKLHTTPEQFRALRQTQLAYRDALNNVSRYAFARGKLSNKVGLQVGTYQELRARFGLPAQMACSVPRQVGATYQTLWTRVKANSTAHAAGLTHKRYRGLDAAPRFVSRLNRRKVFVTLNASARNSNLWFSRTRNVLESAKSN